MDVKSVILPHDIGTEPLDWAKKNCPSYITCTAKQVNVERAYILWGKSVTLMDVEYPIEYHFGDESDAVHFKMTWL